MATHSGILSWKIPWRDEATVHWVTKESDMAWRPNNTQQLCNSCSYLVALNPIFPYALEGEFV